MQGLVIAGTHSGCGKTTVTLGVLAVLKSKGLRVQPFKAGPDFIDTGLQGFIAGRPSRNLDIWMCGKGGVLDCFRRYTKDVDIAVIEGVMGMYDGEFSTADLAVLLNLPIILVIDAFGMAESVGAIVKGFADFEMNGVTSGSLSNKIMTPAQQIAGVIFNRVASERHYERLKNSVRGMRVYGYLPRDLHFEIPHRHLGLTVAEESPMASENVQKLVEGVLAHIDIDSIIALKHGESAEQQAEIVSEKIFLDTTSKPHMPPTSEATIAVAYDKAFNFYYEENLDLLKDAGARILKFSPLTDPGIPDGTDAIYIGGGYPELYAKELSENTSMLNVVSRWAISGNPIYAECGGLMYLSRGIYDFKRTFFRMVDILPFETEMKKGRSHLGYREIELREDCILGRKGALLRGHEFHYSEIKGRVLSSKISSTYSVRDNAGKTLDEEGYRFNNTFASYVHIHFKSNPPIAKNFMHFVESVRKRKPLVAEAGGIPCTGIKEH